MAGAIDGQVQTFLTTNIKLCVPVVTLLTNDNAKLLQQLKCVLKRQLTGINANQKHHCRYKTSIQIT